MVGSASSGPGRLDEASDRGAETNRRWKEGNELRSHPSFKVAKEQER